MNTIWVCNKWRLNTPYNSIMEALEAGGKRTVRHEQRIAHLSANAWCLSKCLPIVGRAGHVVDMCAGIGLWAAILEQELKPVLLDLNDMDEGCAKSLKFSFPDALVTRNSYWDMDVEEADLVCMDITISTATRVFAETAQVPLLKVIGQGAKWVVVSDCAAPKLHLNAENYAKVLRNAPRTYDHYIGLYSEELMNRTGKTIHTAFYSGSSHRPHSCYFLIGPKSGPTKIEKIWNYPTTSFGEKEGLLC